MEYFVSLEFFFASCIFWKLNDCLDDLDGNLARCPGVKVCGGIEMIETRYSSSMHAQYIYIYSYIYVYIYIFDYLLSFSCIYSIVLILLTVQHFFKMYMYATSYLTSS